MSVLSDPVEDLRRTAGDVITTMLRVKGYESWPGLVSNLVNCLTNSDANIVLGSFQALEMLCEDFTYDINNDRTHPLNDLMPTVLQFFRHDHPQVRLYAISCIQKFIFLQPNVMLANMNAFLDGFFHLARENNPVIQERVLIAFHTLVDCRLSSLEQRFGEVVELMLAAQKQGNNDVAVRALEFYPLLSHYAAFCNGRLREYLPRVLEVLMSRMVWTEEDLQEIRAESERAQENVRPTFTTSRVGGTRGDSDDDSEEYDRLEKWGPRSAAGLALEKLAQVMEEPFLPYFLKLLEQGFNSSNWMLREAALMSLGSISIGKKMYLKEHLPAIVPYLFELFKDEHYLIRTITCWTASRYAEWIFLQPDVQKNAHALMTGLLNLVTDSHPRVRRAAVSAIGLVARNIDIKIEPYCDAICQLFRQAFQSRSTLMRNCLYDSISSLSGAMGEKFANGNYMNLIMPPLLEDYERMSNDDPRLFPLLECFAYIAFHIRDKFAPFAKPVFNRCLALIQQYFMSMAMIEQNPQEEPPDRYFVICSLDTISSLAEALRNDFHKLVHDSNFVALLLNVMKTPRPDFDQSSFAAVGDMARFAMGYLHEGLKEIYPLLLAGMRPRFSEACNNAIWALGECVIRGDPQLIAPTVVAVMERLFTIFVDRNAEDLSETVVRFFLS